MVKAYCLKVPKSLGEKSIKLASRLGLLNKDLKVRLIGEYLHIPLNREPPPYCIAEFNEALTQFDILVQDFFRRVKRSQKIFDVIGDRLPPHLLASFPRSIDFVGDIAIVEVPPELEDHKKLIGEVILKVHKNVRTVLAKSSAVKGVYRLREYDIIAGSPNTETVHKEYGCKYHVDLSKVYFSPRLSYEHYRVASQVEEGEKVVDMFAGVGPFSIMIAKMRRNVTVYAVDVNPYAVEYLKRNVAANNVQGRVIPILGDAEKIIRDRLQGIADRVIMNLPEKAIRYVKAACEAVKPEGGIIHYYEFSQEAESHEDIKSRLSGILNQAGRKVEGFLSVRAVREVAPYRWQMAVDIKIR